MFRSLTIALLAAAAAVAPTQLVQAGDPPGAAVPGPLGFEKQVLVTGLAAPWEVTYGPDDMLWVTERVGRRILRIDPATGESQVAVEIGEAQAPGGQDGLMGLALHPELLQGTGNDYVYTAYTYEDEARGPDEQVADPFNPYRFLYTKIVRYTYDAETGTLGDPVDLIAGLPAHNDHNSGRIKVGPDSRLYYSIGDGGKNQLGNWCLPIEAQRLPTADEVAAGDWIAYQGKSLRLELDGGIPADNPELDGVVSHVYTYGHRNMQGLAFAPDGTLYSSEHGPKTDDEVNRLVAGGNYGWPNVAGYRDNSAYQYARWADSTVPCAQLSFTDLAIADSVPRADESEFTEEMVDPVATLFTVPSDWNFSDPLCRGIDFICWPTVAPSSVEVYSGDAIPGWDNSLLVTTLKRGSIYRLPLSADGTTVDGEIERYFRSENRFRDLAISPDGKSIYVATDPGGLAETAEGGVTREVEDAGAILVFTYTGEDAAATETDEAADAADAGAAASAEGAVPTLTAEQSARGKSAYDANCVTCHGPSLTGGAYGTPLTGLYFDDSWRGRTVAELYLHAHDRMPPSRPGSLADEAYADIVAYVLGVNGVAPGATELPANPDALAGMVIPTN